MKIEFINDLVFYKSPAMCVIIGVILLLHILSAALSDRLSLISNYANICLHITLALLMFFKSEASLSELVLIFMASLFVFLSANLIASRIQGTVKSTNDVGGEDENDI